MLELAPGGELYALLQERGRFSEARSSWYMRQMVCGVESIRALVTARSIIPESGRGPSAAANKIAKLAFFLFCSKFCNFFAGSFSALSKRNFARKYAFDSIFQALQDLHTFAPLRSQNFSKKSV